MQVFRIVDFLVGINCGGQNYTSSKGLYLADFVTKGKTFSTNNAIQGTDDDPIYQTERFLKPKQSSLTYDVPVANGVYYVELELAELYFQAPGERIFDVKIEGTVVEDDLDVFAAAGGSFIAYKSGHFVTVADGAVTVVLSKEVQNPTINAFAIYTAEEDLNGPSASIAVSGGTAQLQPLSVVVTFTDDSGLDTSTVELSDVQFTGQASVISQSVFFESSDVAYAIYSLLPTNGWVADQTVEITVPEGVVQDTGGAGNLLATAGFQYVPPLPTLGVDSLADLTQLTLLNTDVTNPTAIDVGADGRLYLAQQNGLIQQLSIVQDVVESGGVTTQTWSVTNRVDITAVQDMPNFNDFGCYDPSVDNRQVTGLVASTDASGLVMLYVSSSDPRIGGGSGGESEDLDTNSGVVSRLTQTPDGQGGFTWEKVDLIRGLPRSEENHATNGMRLYTKTNGDQVLIVTSGGNTNTGAPSNNFVYLPEYYYSGVIFVIDLEKIKTLEAQGINEFTPSGKPKQYYIYDLPTLDDPSRDNVNGLDGPHDTCNQLSFDVMGGNNGLNQAIYDPQQVIWVIASGFRNQYDVVVMSDGTIYTIDNGSNSGWGGNPVDINDNLVVDADDDLVPDNPLTNRANEAGGKENNGDGLHRIGDDIDTILNTDPDSLVYYYGGHPNPFRAYGGGAGLYWYATGNNGFGVAAGTPLELVNKVVTVSTSGEVDLTTLISNIGDMTGTLGPHPREAMPLYIGARKSGITNAENGALWTWKTSTNGVEEYRAGTGDLKGQLLTVSFNGDISAVKFANDGTVDSVTARGLTSKPLDLVAQGDGDSYPGVIFVAAYGSDKVVILSPDATLGENPNPSDRDGDGIDDTVDPFCVDPENGLLNDIVPGETKTWTFVNGDSFPNDHPGLFDGAGGLYNGGDIGFTGIFTNRATLPEGLYDDENIIFGGAPGILQLKSTESGNATMSDDQRNGFQIGINPTFVGLTDFTVRSKIDSFLDEISDLPASERFEQGIQVGAGDQNNFVSLSLVHREDGSVGFEVVSQFTIEFFGAIPATIDFYEVPELANPSALDTVELGFDVNIASVEVKPVWKYTTNAGGTTTSGSGTPVTLTGETEAALKGEYQIADDEGTLKTMGFAVGIVASRGCSCGGRAVAALNAGSSSTVTETVNGLSTTFEPDAFATGVTIVGTTTAVFYGAISVPSTNLDDLYEDERRGTSWGYTVETGGNGEYTVNLFFVEREFSAAGQRVFNVQVEGVVVAMDFDIYATAGTGEATLSATVPVTDGTVDILFTSTVSEAIVNGIIVREQESPPFLTDWDDIVIEGLGSPPADDTPPIATVAMTDAELAADDLLVAVTYADDRGLDVSTISEDDLTVEFGGSHTVSVVEPLTVAPDGLSATITYGIQPTGGWSQGDTMTVKILGGAITDQDGNGNVEISDIFSFGRGQLYLAVNSGTNSDYTASDGIVYQGGYELPISCCKVGNAKANDQSANINGTVDDSLYHQFVWAKRDAAWNIAVPTGTYYVELHFAEVQFADPGTRIMGIDIETFDWLVDYSPTYETAEVFSEIVEVTDGELNLILKKKTKRPMLSAFSIWKTTQPPTLFVKSEE